MNGWAVVGLITLAFVLYTAFVCWRIVRGNRPPPRWPGDP